MNGSPKCPKCGSDMVLRTARRGKHAGKQFWGCSKYPDCKGLINIEEDAKAATAEVDTIKHLNKKSGFLLSEKIVLAIDIALGIGYIIYKLYPFTFTGTVGFIGIGNLVMLALVYLFEGLSLFAVMFLIMLGGSMIHDRGKTKREMLHSQDFDFQAILGGIAVICTGTVFLLTVFCVMVAPRYLIFG